MNVFALKSRAELERACSALTAMQAAPLPVMRAAADGLIAAVYVTDCRTKWPERELAKFRRPVLLVIADDLEPERLSTPPSGWRCARMLRAWAKSAIVHGAAGEAEHYRGAVLMAMATGHAALIETSSACAVLWTEFLAPAMATLTLIPRSGPHPIAPRRETMQ
jgi:hypothetical protein